MKNYEVKITYKQLLELSSYLMDRLKGKALGPATMDAAEIIVVDYISSIKGIPREKLAPCFCIFDGGSSISLITTLCIEDKETAKQFFNECESVCLAVMQDEYSAPGGYVRTPSLIAALQEAEFDTDNEQI